MLFYAFQMSVAIAFLGENAVEAIQVQNHWKRWKNFGDSNTISFKQQLLGLIFLLFYIFKINVAIEFLHNNAVEAI